MWPLFSLSLVFMSVMSFFDWTSFALVYQLSDIGGCDALQQDLEVRCFTTGIHHVLLLNVPPSMPLDNHQPSVDQLGDELQATVG